MNRADAEEAISSLGRAIEALAHTPPDTETAQAEINEALAVLARTPDPYADKALRPGLNHHQASDEPLDTRRYSTGDFAGQGTRSLKDDFSV